MPNIKEIAKAAGVSSSTVSRVINNNSLISSETREHVLKVMNEMNYVPDSMARGLASQKSYSIALLVDIEDSKSFNNPFFYEVMHGIETVVYKRDFSLVIANHNNSSDGVSRLDWLVQGKRAQGVILMSSIVNTKLIKKVKSKNFPFVAIGEPDDILEPIDWVDVDNRQAGKLAVQHLYERGYRKIAFISGELTEVFNRNRLSGYKTMLQYMGLPYLEQYVLECGGNKDDGFAMMSQLLNMETRPDAVICSNNFLTVGAMKALRQYKLNSPNDVGIVSFDNFPIAELVEPTLTTVDIDVFQLGVQAANMLLRIIDNPTSHNQSSLISTSIYERESTKKQ